MESFYGIDTSEEDSLKSKSTPLLTELAVIPIHLAVKQVNQEKGELVEKVGKMFLEKGFQWQTKKHVVGAGDYSGETQVDVRHGHGVQKYNDPKYVSEDEWGIEEQYFGDWVEDRRRGHGVCKYKEGKLVRYSGEWEEGLRHGSGEGYFRNGNVYVGQWRNGVPEGLGMLFYQDGRKTKFIYKENIIDTIFGIPNYPNPFEDHREVAFILWVAGILIFA